MLLPEAIGKAFNLARQNVKADESQFYGPYNALLNHLFPSDEEYIIVPQYKHSTQLKSVNFTTIFIVRYSQHPTFFIKVKFSGSLYHISSYKEADLQIWDQFKHLFEDIKVEVLYRASTMVLKICIYKLNRVCHQLSPAIIPDYLDLVTDMALIDRRNIDVMTPKGEEQLYIVVWHIKEMSSQLWYNMFAKCQSHFLIR
ncbi:hypothetical protein HOY82DRAFT_487257 [Tuber indicum]|nr:hypothetical protein HOY82DRAFT_487257 [Tuber indicum]